MSPVRRSRRLLGALLLVAAVALLLEGAVAPHTHASARPGLFNEDHDLALLATLHGAAVLHDAHPAPFVFSVSFAVIPLGARVPASTPCPTADSRAPPLA